MKIIQALMLVVISISGAAAAEISPRIVGGTVVPDNRYEFMAAIYLDPDGDQRFGLGCGGSLIGGRWILTAAHCVVDPNSLAVAKPSGVAVVIGALNPRDPVYPLIPITRIMPHPDYDTVTFLNDIALLEMEQEYNGPTLRLPGAESGIPSVGEDSIVTGWGLTSEGGNPSARLLEVSLPIVSHADCVNFYPSSLSETSNFCAGGSPQGGKDSCQGDSGGPVIVTRDNMLVQAGIVSYGEGCARPGIPGVYTRLSTFVSWVRNNAEGTSVYAGGSSELLPLNTEINGLVQKGKRIIYRTTGADRVTLVSTSGDADLYIYANSDTNGKIEGISEESIADTDTDIVEVEQKSEIYIAVRGYTDATYTLLATGTAPVGNDIPVTYDIADTYDITDTYEIPVTIDLPVTTATNTLPTGGGAGSVGIVAFLIMLLLALCRHRPYRPERYRSQPDKAIF